MFCSELFDLPSSVYQNLLKGETVILVIYVVEEGEKNLGLVPGVMQIKLEKEITKRKNLLLPIRRSS